MLKAIRNGTIDAADLSFPNLIDDIVLKMRHMRLLEDLANILTDKRKDNSTIPHDIVLLLMIAAKMKIRFSLGNVQYAITDPVALSEIG